MVRLTSLAPAAVFALTASAAAEPSAGVDVTSPFQAASFFFQALRSDLVPSLRGRSLAAHFEIPFAPVSQHPVVDRHNLYRVQHSAPPLSWDKDLAASASDAATNCDSEPSRWGENFYNFSTADLDETAAVDAWYTEYMDYDFANPDWHNKDLWEHFTQVVWVRSERVGCGSAECDFGDVFVCHYDPPGNFRSGLAANVLPKEEPTTVTPGRGGGGATTPAPFDGCKVTLYSDCGYTGDYVTTLTCDGDDICRADMGWLQESAIFHNDDVSSVKVSKGCRLTLWKDGDWSGRSFVVDGHDIPCLADDTSPTGFDDETSSLTIERLPSTPPSKR